MSRQPPLPPGPPPRHYNDSYRDGDSYHPQNRFEPPPPSMYQFGAHGSDSYKPGSRGGESYRPRRSDRDRDYDQRARSPPRYDQGQSQSYRPTYDDRRGATGTMSDRGAPGTMSMNDSSYRQNESFNFRYDAPPGLDYRAADTYRPRSPPPQRDNAHSRRPKFTATRGGYRGRGGPRLASDRAFLKTNREPTPEMLPGMDEDGGTGDKYKAVEDLSDSDETDMEISDGEGGDTKQHRKKQARRGAKAADADDTPKWSNPDPYTVLPPTDDSTHKKKDVVKLIRKARVEASSENKSKTDASTDDFISFDFDDDEPMNEQFILGVNGASSGPAGNYQFKSDVNGASMGSAGNHQYGSGVNGAPTGPRVNNQGSMREQFDRANENLAARDVPTGPRASNNHGVVTRELFDKPSEDFKSQPRSWIPDLIAANLPARPTMNSGNTMRTPDIVPAHDYYPPAGTENSRGKQVVAAPSNSAKSAIIDLTSDPALGSRKRTFNDVIKSPPRIHGDSGGKKPQAKGDIIRMWKATHNEHPTPWISTDHSTSAKMGIWLHKEIVDFYNFVKPRDFERAIRNKVVKDLAKEVENLFSREATILPFGSFPAGLYLPTADMDLVCLSQRYREYRGEIFGTRKSLFRFRDFLLGERLALDNKVEVISGAKVPIVKYVDALTGLKIDISFENDTGINANDTFQAWKAQFPAMPIIVSIIKQILGMRGLNEPVNGGIGGFSIICLVVSLLQNMPQVQSGNMVPEHHLGEILMEFLDLYGNHFNLETTAISLNPAGYVLKAYADLPYNKNSKTNKFCIIDPNRPGNDIAGGSSNTPTIQATFSECFYILQKRMAELQYSPNRQGESILGAIIAGDYSSFRLQREHLAHIHEKKIGPINYPDDGTVQFEY